MKNILITGGPVHAHLDAVKIITNTFKGGFMAELATTLADSYNAANITYLCSKSSKKPKDDFLGNLRVVFHEGFDDYMAKVMEMAPKMDAVILGAAVANLIPYKAIEGKFPSHNYKPGDLVPLIFKIAPRVIDEVKKVAPKTHLFGFKLLDGVDHDELIRAAYGVLLESKATAVIANDKKDLTQKFIVTKERGVHPIGHDKLADWIWEAINDEYYKTEVFPWDVKVVERDNPYPDQLKKVKDHVNDFSGRWGGFLETPEGYVFGTLAQRCGSEGFWTTGRGKREEESFAFVTKVDHTTRVVKTIGPKATLNAPLLSHIFLTLPEVDFIAHSHNNYKTRKFRDMNLPVLEYAPTGTVRDSIRNIQGSFIIKDHGCFLLYNKIGDLII
jgi:hypothetical protein